MGYETTQAEIDQMAAMAKKVIGADIQANKKPIEYMKMACEHLENIIAEMPGHVYWKDVEGHNLGSNRNLVKSLGFSSPNDLKGKTDYDFYAKEKAEEYRKNDREVIETDKIKNRLCLIIYPPYY